MKRPVRCTECDWRGQVKGMNESELQHNALPILLAHHAEAHPPNTGNGLRLETCSEGIARLWDDTYPPHPVAMIVGVYDGWVARPCNVPGVRGWGWMCPTRREAVAAVTAWLDTKGIR